MPNCLLYLLHSHSNLLYPFSKPSTAKRKFSLALVRTSLLLRRALPRQHIEASNMESVDVLRPLSDRSIKSADPNFQSDCAAAVQNAQATLLCDNTSRNGPTRQRPHFQAASKRDSLCTARVSCTRVCFQNVPCPKASEHWSRTSGLLLVHTSVKHICHTTLLKPQDYKHHALSNICSHASSTRCMFCECSSTTRR